MWISLMVSSLTISQLNEALKTRMRRRRPLIRLFYIKTEPNIEIGSYTSDSKARPLDLKRNIQPSMEIQGIAAEHELLLALAPLHDLS